ncbi:MAG: UPF0489 family protein [Clostridia bacterium]|nr:UPF0489 family protein [Clostridia bacterium]
MMRVLDIDLDFFLNDVCPFADVGQRPDVRGREPWKEEDVVSFLETRLLLSKTRPIPGRVFETHDMALDFWKDLMDGGLLSAPFSVTHVDAHTDLGIVQKGYPFVRHNVLSRPVEKRVQLNEFREKVQLNEANYLAFAIGFRWIERLENVRNPKSKPDFPKEMLAETNPPVIQLKSAFPQLFEARFGYEPAIAYYEYPTGESYRATEPFDCVSLAVSPRYAPKEADELIKVFERYMVKA